MNTNKITKTEFLDLNEDNLMFITNPGRMGDEDGSTFIIRKGNEFTVYRVDGWMYQRDAEISYRDAIKQFPKWEDILKHKNEENYKGKYKHIYMGFGNGLSIDNSIYSEYEPYLNSQVEKYLENSNEEDKESLKYAAIFNVWPDAFMDMVNDKKYVLTKK